MLKAFTYSYFFYKVSDCAKEISIVWLLINTASNISLISKYYITYIVVKVLFMPFSGVLGDRYSIRFLALSVYTINIISFAYLLFIIHFYMANYTLLLPFIILSAIGNSVIVPLSKTAIKHLSQAPHLFMNVKRYSFVIYLASGIGTICGGFFAKNGVVKGLAALFILNGVSIFILIINYIWAKGLNEAARSSDSTDTCVGWTKHLYRTCRIVFFIKTERYISLFSMVVNAIYIPFISVLLPAFIKLHLHLSAIYLSYANIAYSLGCAICSIYVLDWVNKYLSKHVSLLLTLNLSGLIIAIIPQVHEFHILIILLILLSLMFVTHNINIFSAQLRVFPEDYCNSIFMCKRLLSELCLPIGFWVIKILNGFFGNQKTMILSGIIIFSMSFLVILIPNLSEIFDRDVTSGLYRKLYPRAFCFKDAE